MTIVEGLLQELNQEAQTTRRVLERVPGDQLNWKPHAKSMSLGQLALHVATCPVTSRKSRSSRRFRCRLHAAERGQRRRACPRSIRHRRRDQVLRSLDEAALGKIWRVVDGERK